jgi:hypothetical protein
LENRADAVSHTAHRHHMMERRRKNPEQKRERELTTITWRTNTGNLSRSSASLRSDHDAVVRVITMAWTD